MARRNEFPALEARRGELERQHAEARLQISRGVYTNNLQEAVFKFDATVREELDELTYVLNEMKAHQNKIEISIETLIAAGVVAVIVAVVQIVLLGAH